MMNKNFSKSKNGFSLIELLLVMAIMLIMTAVLFAGDNKKRKADTDVESASRQIAAQIRALQNDSLSGKRFDLGGGIIKYAYQFKFERESATQYSISYYDYVPTIIGAKQIFDLAKKRVTLAASPTSFYFQAPDGKANPATTLTITSTVDDSFVKYICVSAAGLVVEQDSGTCN